MVALALDANLLAGPLPSSFDALGSLQVLDLRGNALTGALPTFERVAPAPALLSLRLESNEFDYDHAAAPYDPHVEALATLCGGGGAVCSGLPPTSCAAFGASYQQRLDDPMQCVECEAIWTIALLFGCLVCLMLVAAATYIRLILRHHEALQRWVSTSALFLGHAQTLSLIGLLKLGWPRSAEAVTDTLGFDLVNLGGSKPECLLQDLSQEAKQQVEELGGTFFLVTVARMVLVGLMLLGVTLAQLCVKKLPRGRRGRGRRAAGEGEGKEEVTATQELNDKLEFVETVVFSLQLTITVRAAVQMMSQ